MSSSARAVRRLALLAGSSLTAASLALTSPAFAAETVVTIPEGTTQTTTVTASPAAGDTFVLDIEGTLRRGGGGNTTNVSVQGSGAGDVTIINDGRLQGRFDFSAAAGSITLRNNTGPLAATQGWHTGNVTTLGSGNDLFDNAEGGVIATTNDTTFDFSAGEDRFLNEGRLIVDRGGSTGSLTLTGLETFENSGLILLGSPYTLSTDDGLDSDGGPNDRLVAQGVAFTGSGASRIAMDVQLAEVTQPDCSAAVAADCVDFTGGSTAGSTLLTITDAGFSDAGALNEGIVLIAGASAVEHFVLDPATPNYLQTSRGVALQKRLVTYLFVYDPDAKTHSLVGTPADEAFQPGTFAASAQETWRASAGTWLTRQADLRATPGGLQPSYGAWGRIGGGVSERDGEASFDMGGTTYSYDLAHKQKNAHLVFGADFVGAASADAAFVVGGMLGFVRSDVEYDATPTEVIYSGATGGLYASYVAGPLFVDALFNANVLDMEADLPNLGLATDVKLTQTIKSLGGQLEAGWRLPMANGVFVEPLAGVSYVETQFEDIDIPGGGGTFDFEDSYTSFRAGAGARVGMESSLLGMAASYSLTGRYWNEFEGENAATAVITNGMTEIPLMDDFSGGFGEVSGTVNLYSDDGLVSVFANLGGRFGDEYEAMDASAGVRLRW